MSQNPVTPFLLLRHWIAPIILVVSLSVSAPAKSADLDAFHAAVEGVNRPYTSALFYLRTGNTGLASFDLMAARSRWQKLLEQFQDSPPIPLNNDANWNSSLAAIASAFEKGIAQADAGEVKAAQETLLLIRTTLYDLRNRNGLRVLADCIFELNKQMDALYEYRHAPPDLERAEIRMRVTEMGAAYAQLVSACRQLAPQELRQNTDFQSLFDGTLKSINSIVRPVETKDQRGVINVLRELKSFDRLLWLRWG